MTAIASYMVSSSTFAPLWSIPNTEATVRLLSRSGHELAAHYLSGLTFYHSPSPSFHSSHNAVPGTCQAHSHLRAFTPPLVCINSLLPNLQTCKSHLLMSIAGIILRHLILQIVSASMTALKTVCLRPLFFKVMNLGKLCCLK